MNVFCFFLTSRESNRFIKNERKDRVHYHLRHENSTNVLTRVVTFIRQKESKEREDEIDDGHSFFFFTHHLNEPEQNGLVRKKEQDDVSLPRTMFHFSFF